MDKISDTGDFIPGAQKHLRARGSSSSRAGAGNANSAESRLSQLWPEPDWSQLARENRFSPATLGAMATAYWSLSANPHQREFFGVKSQDWPALYEQGVAIVRQVVEGAHRTERLPEMRDRAVALLGAAKNASLSQVLPIAAVGRFGGRSLYPPFRASPKMAWLKDSMVELGWPDNGAVMKSGIGVIASKRSSKPDDHDWMVICTQPRPRVVDGHEKLTRAEALIRAQEDIAALMEMDANAKETRRKVTRRAAVDLGGRIGPDYLQGRDISPEELINTFRLRGVQFGESLSEPEKQRWLNEAFGALHDLARVLGFKPSWIGLGGGDEPRLALAIGARGKSNHAAHFEPSLRVINLTRESGAGSLAHEWAHAYDCHLACRTFADSFKWGGGATAFFSEVEFLAEVGLTSRKDALTAAIALCHALFSMEQNTYRDQAVAIERLKGARKRYWTKGVELWARSFESYVEDRLWQAGEISPWLVHGTLPSAQAEPSLSPYPLGAQRYQFNELWNHMIAQLCNPSA